MVFFDPTIPLTIIFISQIFYQCAIPSLPLIITLFLKSPYYLQILPLPQYSSSYIVTVLSTNVVKKTEAAGVQLYIKIRDREVKQ